MFTSIAERAVVVTGGSRGIGKGIAGVFARNGARVLITGRSEQDLAATAEELGVSYLVADVASKADCERVAAMRSRPARRHRRAVRQRRGLPRERGWPT